MVGDIFVVTGPPAVGKSTLARSLAAARNPSVHLHADDFWGLIVNGYVDPWLPAAEAQNEIVLRAACGTAADLATGGYHVVYDGVLGPWFLDTLLDRCPPDQMPVDYLILLPPVESALARLTSRTDHGFTSETAMAHMYAQFRRAVPGLERHVMTAGDLPPEEVVQRAELAAAAGHLRLTRSDR